MANDCSVGNLHVTDMYTLVVHVRQLEQTCPQLTNFPREGFAELLL